MTAPPGVTRTPSTTAGHTAEGGKEAEVHPALIRKTTKALSAVAGVPWTSAQQQVKAWIAGGAASSDLEAWLRQNYLIDPTGVTAVRNVTKGSR